MLVPAPLALVTGFLAGFSCYPEARLWKGLRALRRGGMAGVVVILPVVLIGGLLIDSVDLGRSAVVGAVGGAAVGAAGGLVAVFA